MSSWRAMRAARGGAARRDGAHEISEALLPDRAAARLSAENLRVLVEDLEQCLQDVTDVLSARRSAGWAQKCEAALGMAQQVLQELRTQGRSASRQDQATCKELVRLFERVLQQAAASFQAAQAAAAGGEDEERRTAAGKLLQQVTQVQDDSQASVARSVRLVSQSQQVGQETAVLVKAQTEQVQRVRGLPRRSVCTPSQRAHAAVQIGVPLHASICA